MYMLFKNQTKYTGTSVCLHFNSLTRHYFYNNYLWLMQFIHLGWRHKHVYVHAVSMFWQTHAEHFFYRNSISTPAITTVIYRKERMIMFWVLNFAPVEQSTNCNQFSGFLRSVTAVFGIEKNLKHCILC